MNMKKLRFLLFVMFAVAVSGAARAQSKPPLPLPSRERPPTGEPKTETPARPDGALTMLRITVVTGGDDLRTDSRLSAFIIRRDGTRLQSAPLNCQRVERDGARIIRASLCEKIPNNTRRTYQLDLTKEPALLPEDVHRFGLSFESGRANVFDTGDNWNLDRLEVEYVVNSPRTNRPGMGGGARTMPMLELSGTPLYRFKTTEEWESEPLRLGGGGVRSLEEIKTLPRITRP